jgi:glycosyltransferase involved in cell wall biosynthesis
VKKLLVITYYWPPSGGAGVQRWLKLVKYLAQMGWEVHVVTVDPKVATYPQRDLSLPEEVEGVTVHRTDTSEPYRYYTFFSGGKVPSAGFANEGTGDNAGPLKRLARFVRGNVFIPDPRKGWNRFAERTALDLIDRHGITTVITTSPPHSSQLIGLKLKQQRDIRWLADMRDPWTGIYYAHELRQTAWAAKRNLDLEREVLTKADHIITVSQQLKRDFLKLHPHLSPEKLSVIPNGYDPDDFKSAVSVERQFTIGYMGTITPQYDIRALLSVLSEMKDKLRLRFIGEVPGELQRALQSTGHACEFTGYLPHDEALRRAGGCALLLLVIPRVADNAGIVTGKVFEYLALQRPILGIGPVAGDAAGILQEAGAGRMFDYADAEGMRHFISAVQSGQVLTSENSMAYSRKMQAELLGRLLLD